MRLIVLSSIYTVIFIIGLILSTYNLGFDDGYKTGVTSGYFKLDKPKGLK